MNKLARAIRKVHQEARLTDFHVTAMHVHGDLGFAVRLAKLAEGGAARQHVNFETGVFMKLQEPVTCTFTVFHNGRFVMTGLVSRADIKRAVETFFAVVVAVAS